MGNFPESFSPSFLHSAEASFLLLWSIAVGYMGFDVLSAEYTGLRGSGKTHEEAVAKIKAEIWDILSAKGITRISG